jgi:hypothetical protein
MNVWDTSDEKRTSFERESKLTWDTSDEKRTGGPGHTGYTTYTSGVYCSTQDNRALVLQ